MLLNNVGSSETDSSMKFDGVASSNVTKTDGKLLNILRHGVELASRR